MVKITRIFKDYQVKINKMVDEKAVTQTIKQTSMNDQGAGLLIALF